MSKRTAAIRETSPLPAPRGARRTTSGTQRVALPREHAGASRAEPRDLPVCGVPSTAEIAEVTEIAERSEPAGGAEIRDQRGMRLALDAPQTARPSQAPTLAPAPLAAPQSRDVHAALMLGLGLVAGCGVAAIAVFAVVFP